MQLKCLIVFPVVGLLIVAGCGEKESVDENKTSESGIVTSDPTDLLIGTWYGRARLNQERLDQKLASLDDPAQRESLIQVSRIFRTTEIGARFSENGSMELDVQIQPDGQTLRDSTLGNWKVIDVEANAVLIETMEQLPAGGTETNQIRYQFEQDGNLAVMVAPTSEQLADCNPVFVFQRVNETAEIADRASGGSLK